MGNPETGMIIVLLLIFGPLLLWLHDFFERRQEEGKAEEIETGEAITTVNEIKKATAIDAGREDASDEQNASEQEAPLSLIRMYAKEHDLWICPYCETLNEHERHDCIACGAKQ